MIFLLWPLKCWGHSMYQRKGLTLHPQYRGLNQWPHIYQANPLYRAISPPSKDIYYLLSVCGCGHRCALVYFGGREQLSGACLSWGRGGAPRDWVWVIMERLLPAELSCWPSDFVYFLFCFVLCLWFGYWTRSFTCAKQAHSHWPTCQLQGGFFEVCLSFIDTSQAHVVPMCTALHASSWSPQHYLCPHGTPALPVSLLTHSTLKKSRY